MTYEVKSGGLVPAGEGVEEALAAFERADTQAILEHLTTGGVGLENFLYTFPMGQAADKREVIGVSWAGAKEIARLLGNIEVLPDVKVEEREDAFYGVVRVKDLSCNFTVLGVARQPKEKVLRSGEVKPDEHAFVIAINKAQRNGILSLVDEAVKVRLVTEFLSTRRKKELGRRPAAPNTGIVPPSQREQPGEGTSQGETSDADALTEDQRKAIYALGRDRGLDDQALHEFTARKTGKEHISQLTRKEASEVIRALQKQGALQ
jgi:hypothetical protein